MYIVIKCDEIHAARLIGPLGMHVWSRPCWAVRAAVIAEGMDTGPLWPKYVKREWIRDRKWKFGDRSPVPELPRFGPVSVPFFFIISPRSQFHPFFTRYYLHAKHVELMSLLFTCNSSQDAKHRCRDISPGQSPANQP